jgi:CRP-like cAMP-binding protein
LHRGAVLCHQGDEWPYAVFVARGELRWAILSVGGREQVLFRIETGRTFWAHSLFDGEPMPASLTAAKASLVYLWPQEVIAPMLSRNPALLWEILRIMMGTMRRAREVIYGLAFKPVAGRLAKLLLEQAVGQEDQPVQREMTLSEIAATVATSQEVVCRLLYQFQADKIIELNRASFKLSDRAALEKMVEKT